LLPSNQTRLLLTSALSPRFVHSRPWRVSTPAQAEALFAIVERQRVFVERLYQRCVELGYPKHDHLRLHAAFAVVAQRKLCLVVNESRQKGVYRRYLLRSRSWPRMEV
jgi:hypothetical protein